MWWVWWELAESVWVRPLCGTGMEAWPEPWHTANQEQEKRKRWGTASSEYPGRFCPPGHPAWQGVWWPKPAMRWWIFWGRRTAVMTRMNCATPLSTRRGWSGSPKRRCGTYRKSRMWRKRAASVRRRWRKRPRKPLPPKKNWWKI